MVVAPEGALLGGESHDGDSDDGGDSGGSSGDDDDRYRRSINSKKMPKNDSLFNLALINYTTYLLHNINSREGSKDWPCKCILLNWKPFVRIYIQT